MPLPRSLQEDLEEYLREPDPAWHLIAGYNAAVNLSPQATQALLNAQEKGVPRRKLAHDMLRAYFRITARPVVQANDELTRSKAQLYVGLEERSETTVPAFREVDIPRYFQPRLDQLNEQWKKNDRDALELRRKIAEIRDRKYASRTFPAALKAIIFERDNYTCRICLRDRLTLQGNGLHLECDHILPWEDNGPTTYDNGQTICSECNKAKHHAKRYLGLVARLRSEPTRK